MQSPRSKNVISSSEREREGITIEVVKDIQNANGPAESEEECLRTTGRFFSLLLSSPFNGLFDILTCVFIASNGILSSSVAIKFHLIISSANSKADKTERNSPISRFSITRKEVTLLLALNN